MYYVIVNPASRSGKGARIWSALEPVFTEKEIPCKVFFSREPGHAVKIVRDLFSSLVDASGHELLKLIVLGGDGTFNEVLQGISDFDRVQLGYIPTGSSNDLARDLKIPLRPADALDRILSCEKATAMDIGCAVYENSFTKGAIKRYFAVSCGIGFDAAVCQEALSSGFKNILNKIGLGRLTYLIIALKQLIATRKTSCQIFLDDREPVRLSRFLFVTGMIHQYEGGGFRFCPGADDQDGIIDLCAVGNISKWLVVAALPTAFKGNHYRFNGIDRYSAKSVRIKASAPLWLHTDGEVSCKVDTVTLTCEKQKLSILK